MTPLSAASQVYDPRRGPHPEAVYDPRLLLTGAVDAIGKRRGGIFDEGSFCETLAGGCLRMIDVRFCVKFKILNVFRD